jgi:hypothetical protein
VRIAASRRLPSRTLPPVSITATASLPTMNPTLAVAPSLAAVMSARAPMCTKTPRVTSVTGRGSSGCCAWATNSNTPEASTNVALKIGIDRAMQRLSGIPRAGATPAVDKHEL